MKKLMDQIQFQNRQIPISIIEIENIIKKKIRGVIHIGANYGEETNEYRMNNIEKVIWVEPLKDGFDQLKLLEETYGDKIFNCAIGDRDGETEFHMTNNLVSSSIRNLGSHLQMAPDCIVAGKLVVPMKRLDTLIRENNIDINEYNMLNIDTQGTEDLVLMGCEENLKYFDALCIETNDDNAYVGCKNRLYIQNYLKDRGFIPLIVTKVNRIQYEELYMNIVKG